MATALLIKTDGTTERLTLNSESNYELIRDSVGGLLDSVANDEIVCYVHDEGLLIGLPVNVIASSLFSRPLVGDVVLVGRLNEFGESDGYDHQLPEFFLSDKFALATQLMNTDEGLIAELTEYISEMDFSPTITSLTDEQMNHYLRTGEFPTDDKGDKS